MRGFTVNIENTERIELDGAGSDPRISPKPEAAVSAAVISEPLSSEEQLRSGQLIEHYRIRELIAVGGTAKVYEAVHEFTNKLVALKIMRSRLQRRPDVIERFRQEAIALASIKHVNVVAVDNAGLTQDGRVFIAMELLRGQTLRALLEQRGRLSSSETIQILLDVSSGVAAAHDAGITHRDLKPENVFCVRDGNAKVLDLGTAKYAGENGPCVQTAVGRVIGTVPYIAPERFDGNPGDARSDIYSLGLIAYECLAGHHPLVPDGNWPSAAELAERQVRFRPGRIEGIAPAIWAVVQKAIQKSPSHRFQSVAELIAALRDASERPQRFTEEAGRVENRARPVGNGRAARRLSGTLAVPIVAGTLFGAAVAGSVQGVRFARSRVVTEPTAMIATVSLVQPTASEPESGMGTAQPIVFPASPVSVLSDVPKPRTSPSAVPNHQGNAAKPAVMSPAPVQAGPPATREGQHQPVRRSVATELPASREAQEHSASSPSRAYDQPPAVPKPKDDLPASGL